MGEIVAFKPYRVLHIERFRTLVESMRDPRNKNRNAYRITGDRYEDVQGQIAAVTAEVESFGNGYAHFFGPIQLDDGRFAALGQAVVVVHE